MQIKSLQCCNARTVGFLANARDMGDEFNDKELIEALIKWAGVSASDLARQAKLTPSTLTRPLNQPVTHRLSLPTISKLRAAFPRFPGWGIEPDLPTPPAEIDYVSVDILPTFAGMGGGGSGDGDLERAMVPLYLIRDVFRGRPENFVLVRTRGDSMVPDFTQDDEVLVDKRDVSPVQPGPFAIFDADEGAYVLKNVEKLPGGKIRIFSTNPKYSPAEVSREETHILGRPVWVGRRL